MEPFGSQHSESYQQVEFIQSFRYSPYEEFILDIPSDIILEADKLPFKKAITKIIEDNKTIKLDDFMTDIIQLNNDFITEELISYLYTKQDDVKHFLKGVKGKINAAKRRADKQLKKQIQQNSPSNKSVAHVVMNETFKSLQRPMLDQFGNLYNKTDAEWKAWNKKKPETQKAIMKQLFDDKIYEMEALIQNTEQVGINMKDVMISILDICFNAHNEKVIPEFTLLILAMLLNDNDQYIDNLVSAQTYKFLAKQIHLNTNQIQLGQMKDYKDGFKNLSQIIIKSYMVQPEKLTMNEPIFKFIFAQGHSRLIPQAIKMTIKSFKDFLGGRRRSSYLSDARNKTLESFKRFLITSLRLDADDVEIMMTNDMPAELNKEAIKIWKSKYKPKEISKLVQCFGLDEEEAVAFKEQIDRKDIKTQDIFNELLHQADIYYDNDIDIPKLVRFDRIQLRTLIELCKQRNEEFMKDGPKKWMKEIESIHHDTIKGFIILSNNDYEEVSKELSLNVEDVYYHFMSPFLTEAALISGNNKGQIIDPQQIYLAQLMMSRGKCHLTYPTGCGKTNIIIMLASYYARYNHQVIIATQNLVLCDQIGQMIQRFRHLTKQCRIMTFADALFQSQTASVIIIDEVDRCISDTLYVRSDDDRIFTLDSFIKVPRLFSFSATTSQGYMNILRDLMGVTEYLDKKPHHLKDKELYEMFDMTHKCVKLPNLKDEIISTLKQHVELNPVILFVKSDMYHDISQTLKDNFGDIPLITDIKDTNINEKLLSFQSNSQGIMLFKDFKHGRGINTITSVKPQVVIACDCYLLSDLLQACGRGSRDRAQGKTIWIDFKIEGSYTKRLEALSVQEDLHSDLLYKIAWIACACNPYNRNIFNKDMTEDECLEVIKEVGFYQDLDTPLKNKNSNSFKDLNLLNNYISMILPNFEDMIESYTSKELIKWEFDRYNDIQELIYEGAKSAYRQRIERSKKRPAIMRSGARQSSQQQSKRLNPYDQQRTQQIQPINMKRFQLKDKYNHLDIELKFNIDEYKVKCPELGTYHQMGKDIYEIAVDEAELYKLSKEYFGTENQSEGEMLQQMQQPSQMIPSNQGQSIHPLQQMQQHYQMFPASQGFNLPPQISKPPRQQNFSQHPIQYQFSQNPQPCIQSMQQQLPTSIFQTLEQKANIYHDSSSENTNVLPEPQFTDDYHSMYQNLHPNQMNLPIPASINQFQGTSHQNLILPQGIQQYNQQRNLNERIQHDPGQLYQVQDPIQNQQRSEDQRNEQILQGNLYQGDTQNYSIFNTIEDQTQLEQIQPQLGFQVPEQRNQEELKLDESENPLTYATGNSPIQEEPMQETQARNEGELTSKEKTKRSKRLQIPPSNLILRSQTPKVKMEQEKKM